MPPLGILVPEGTAGAPAKEPQTLGEPFHFALANLLVPIQIGPVQQSIESSGKLVEGGRYLSIDRTWQPGDTVNIFTWTLSISPSQSDHRRGVTLIEMLVVLLILVALLALIIPATQRARESARAVT